MAIQTAETPTNYFGGTIESIVGRVSPEHVNYIPLEQVPKLERAFRIARLRLSMLRRELGLEHRTINHSEVRLVPARDYDKHLAPLAGKKSTDGIHYRATGLSFVRIDENDLSNNFELVLAAKTMAHEMFHWAVGDNLPGSLDLEEGLAEFFARDTMRYTIPLILEPDEQLCNETMIKIDRPSSFDGFKFDARHAVVYNPNTVSVKYTSRFRELDLVESIFEQSPQGYKKILRLALGADSSRYEAKAA